uniref:Uncharacterized protein n=1 Tax=Glossina pallidipes TaxID=7398 RepID=A0A1A9ZZS1_GLOPL
MILDGPPHLTIQQMFGDTRKPKQIYSMSTIEIVIYKHDFRCVTSGSNSRRVSWPRTQQSYFRVTSSTEKKKGFTGDENPMKNLALLTLTIIQYHAEIICLYLGWAIVCLPACLFVLQKSEANEKEYEKYKRAFGEQLDDEWII